MRYSFLSRNKGLLQNFRVASGTSAYQVNGLLHTVSTNCIPCQESIGICSIRCFMVKMCVPGRATSVFQSVLRGIATFVVPSSSPPRNSGSKELLTCGRPEDFDVSCRLIWTTNVLLQTCGNPNPEPDGLPAPSVRGIRGLSNTAELEQHKFRNQLHSPAPELPEKSTSYK